MSYVFASAHDIAAQKQHKSVSASDVLKALEQIEMGDMVQKLQSDLNGMCAFSWIFTLLILIIFVLYKPIVQTRRERRVALLRLPRARPQLVRQRQNQTLQPQNLLQQ